MLIQAGDRSQNLMFKRCRNFNGGKDFNGGWLVVLITQGDGGKDFNGCRDFNGGKDIHGDGRVVLITQVDGGKE